MRRLAITKRVSLAGVAEGWDESCYALVMPPSNEEYIDFTTTTAAEDMSNIDKFKWQIEFVKKHLVSGKVKVLDDSGNLVLDDLLTEDIDASKELADLLFIQSVGLDLDPKGLSTAMETSPTPEPTTEL
ncbi:hypothetical protein QFZ60_001598 [Arthrobacter sp. B2I5]|uniref:hypothetical protein n=1 Tax=Arthrobacter sp. B2I5 TaxID=3042266 RepID=UPI00277F06A8|nr:hypothetical protein [Arthrobacter sp. B2I5]MDQ0825425.1 hypothetical protein [Arthrobacter sp. B2I5]